jgi:hypothetical protein
MLDDPCSTLKKIRTCAGCSCLPCRSPKPLLGSTNRPTGVLLRLHWCHSRSSGSCCCCWPCCCSSSGGRSADTPTPELRDTPYRLTAPGWAPRDASAIESVPSSCATGLDTASVEPSGLNASCACAPEATSPPALWMRDQPCWPLDCCCSVPKTQSHPELETTASSALGPWPAHSSTPPDGSDIQPRCGAQGQLALAVCTEHICMHAVVTPRAHTECMHAAMTSQPQTTTDLPPCPPRPAHLPRPAAVGRQVPGWRPQGLQEPARLPCTPQCPALP